MLVSSTGRHRTFEQGKKLTTVQDEKPGAYVRAGEKQVLKD
jgi:hypothetical protein